MTVNVGPCFWVPGFSHFQVPGGGQTSLITPEQKKDGEKPRWDWFRRVLNRTFGVCSYPIRSLEKSRQVQVTRREYLRQGSKPQTRVFVATKHPTMHQSDGVHLAAAQMCVKRSVLGTVKARIPAHQLLWRIAGGCEERQDSIKTRSFH